MKVVCQRVALLFLVCVALATSRVKADVLGYTTLAVIGTGAIAAITDYCTVKSVKNPLTSRYSFYSKKLHRYVKKLVDDPLGKKRSSKALQICRVATSTLLLAGVTLSGICTLNFLYSTLIKAVGDRIKDTRENSPISIESPTPKIVTGDVHSSDQTINPTDK